MTREEEIYNAMGDAEWKHIDGTKDIELFDMGFKEGVEWADAHPHWISVEDELPPLIDKNNPYGESVQVLFVVVLDGVQYINKGTFDYDTGVWHSLDMQCSFCKYNVTHWIPQPTPPSESVTTCNHKTSSSSEIPNNLKGGER